MVWWTMEWVFPGLKRKRLVRETYLKRCQERQRRREQLREQLRQQSLKEELLARQFNRTHQGLWMWREENNDPGRQTLVHKQTRFQNPCFTA